jgi:anti-anti-sigma factor
MEDAGYSIHFDEDGIAVITIRGELNTYNTEDFKANLHETLLKTNKVICDFSFLEFICSASVGVLINSLKEARLHGGNIIVFGIQERLKKLFEAIGFTKVFNIGYSLVDTYEEAKQLILGE